MGTRICITFRAGASEFWLNTAPVSPLPSTKASDHWLLLVKRQIPAFPPLWGGGNEIFNQDQELHPMQDIGMRRPNRVTQLLLARQRLGKPVEQRPTVVARSETAFAKILRRR